MVSFLKKTFFSLFVLHYGFCIFCNAAANISSSSSKFANSTPTINLLCLRSADNFHTFLCNFQKELKTYSIITAEETLQLLLNEANQILPLYTKTVPGNWQELQNRFTACFVGNVKADANSENVNNAFLFVLMALVDRRSLIWQQNASVRENMHTSPFWLLWSFLFEAEFEKNKAFLTKYDEYLDFILNVALPTTISKKVFTTTSEMIIACLRGLKFDFSGHTFFNNYFFFRIFCTLSYEVCNRDLSIDQCNIIDWKKAYRIFSKIILAKTAQRIKMPVSGWKMLRHHFQSAKKISMQEWPLIEKFLVQCNLRALADHFFNSGIFFSPNPGHFLFSNEVVQKWPGLTAE